MTVAQLESLVTLFRSRPAPPSADPNFFRERMEKRDVARAKALLAEAGFSRIHCFQALGSPPTAIVARAEK